LQVDFLCKSIGSLQHHMAAGTFLGMKPEIARAGLAQADPIILKMVTAHLDY
jgi:hypothetical protein